MAWLIMSLRRNELQHSLNDHQFEKLQVSRQLRRLASFSSAAADGRINPSEIAGLGIDLFGDAMDFMQYGHDAASEVAAEQTDFYTGVYEGLTQEQYYNNPSIGAQASLYYDENGNFDTDKMYSKFYEEALKEYAEEVLMPILNEKEKELQDKETELETLVTSEQAELDELKNQISTEIENTTIKLS